MQVSAVLAGIMIVVGECALFLDLGNRLFGSGRRTPARALGGVAVCILASLCLALPFFVATTELTPSGPWYLLSCVVSLVPVVHFLFPCRFGIRRVREEADPVPAEPLAKGIVLQRVVAGIPVQREKPLSILIVSDLHCTSSSKLQRLTHAFAKLARRGYDMLFVLGDLGENAALIPDVMRALATINTRYGTFLVRGNHDLEQRRGELVESAARDHAIILLSNAAHIVHELGIQIIGVEHPWYRGALPARSPEHFAIALTHTPDNIRILNRMNIPLAVAGHTHGGMLALPLIGSIVVPSRYGRFLDKGWFQYRNTRLYINPGIGQFPGLFGRFGAVVELVLVSDMDSRQPNTAHAGPSDDLPVTKRRPGHDDTGQ